MPGSSGRDHYVRMCWQTFRHVAILLLCLFRLERLGGFCPGVECSKHRLRPAAAQTCAIAVAFSPAHMRFAGLRAGRDRAQPAGGSSSSRTCGPACRRQPSLAGRHGPEEALRCAAMINSLAGAARADGEACARGVKPSEPESAAPCAPCPTSWYRHDVAEVILDTHFQSLAVPSHNTAPSNWQQLLRDLPFYALTC